MNESIRNQIAALEELRLPDLQSRYAEVLGEETRAPNRAFLIRRITEALEAQAATEPEPPPDDAAAEPDEAERSEASLGPTAAPPEPEALIAMEPTATPNDEATPTAIKLSKLDLPTLQARYLEAVGRPTGSDDSAYLIWKIRQAEKGKIPVGPRPERRAAVDAQEHRVLPLRMDAELVARLDEARERLGLKSRMDLFRRALQSYLSTAGEHEVAALFALET